MYPLTTYLYEVELECLHTRVVGDLEARGRVVEGGRLQHLKVVRGHHVGVAHAAGHSRLTQHQLTCCRCPVTTFASVPDPAQVIRPFAAV